MIKKSAYFHNYIKIFILQTIYHYTLQILFYIKNPGDEVDIPFQPLSHGLLGILQHLQYKTKALF